MFAEWCSQGHLAELTASRLLDQRLVPCQSTHSDLCVLLVI